MREKIDWEKVRELGRQGKREGIWPRREEAVARLVDSQQVGVRGRLNSTSGIGFRVRVIARKMGGGEVREGGEFGRNRGWMSGRRARKLSGGWVRGRRRVVTRDGGWRCAPIGKRGESSGGILRECGIGSSQAADRGRERNRRGQR